MVIAPLAAGHDQGVRQTLERMNALPGMADPRNGLLPFGAFEKLHFARFAVLDDPSAADIQVYGVKRAPLPTYLAFMGDCDGSAHELLGAVARQAGSGLREVFGHCADFEAGTDVLSWMLAHDRPHAATYVNWVGRTVLQIKEESALQRALSARVPRQPLDSGADAQRLRGELLAFVDAELSAERLRLTPPEPTPLGWIIGHIAYLITVPVITLLVSPLILVLLPFLVWQLRRLETTDPEICPRPTIEALQTLQRIEDVDVTNQYTAIGSLKPGGVRGGLVIVLLLLIDYFARMVFTCGYLARVRTIHFARWVFIDGRSRMVFASSYDGGHEAYMDDFINKVAWGLNLVFSNGVGWPSTDWLILRGARREHLFKYFQRRHQIPTQVWYKAYPGLTLLDLDRNQRIRQGLQSRSLSDAAALDWLR